LGQTQILIRLRRINPLEILNAWIHALIGFSSGWLIRQRSVAD
jgi:hypothetical protein